MAPAVYGHVCLLYTIKPFVEESKGFFSPGFKQLQIAAKLFSPAHTEGRRGAEEGERLSRSNKNPGESINPSPLVRSEIFLQMFQDVWPK